ncbi:MAG: hypothetical protein KGK34_04395 [Chloroflexota bacterium]|nr:hypothetical protein [Chloroflexota bacterium]
MEAALQAMAAQNVLDHLRWFDDDVVLDVEGAPTVRTKARYFQENALALVPGTGVKLLNFEVKNVGSSGPDGQWVATTLTFEVTKDGRAFPGRQAEFEGRDSDAWYAVRGERIVHVRVRSVPQVWRFRSGGSSPK